jgi:hypothetical protein
LAGRSQSAFSETHGRLPSGGPGHVLAFAPPRRYFHRFRQFFVHLGLYGLCRLYLLLGVSDQLPVAFIPMM